MTARAVFLLMLVGIALPLRGDGVAAAGIYSADPEHLWNRLHASFYRRQVEIANVEGKVERGPDVLDPPLGVHPRYLLEDAPFAASNAVLDEFLAARGERLITEPLRRAMLQRDLWAVFDLLQTERESIDRNFGEISLPQTPAHHERRATLSGKLARVIAALALPRARLEALPDTYAAALEARTFPADPAASASQEKADYLPADLFAGDSPWIEVSGPSVAHLHTRAVDGRSVFRIFYRPPADTEGAAMFAAWLEQRRRFKPAAELDLGGPEWEEQRRGIPPGTQFLLLRTMIAIDDEWALVPTRVVESVQVRVFRPTPPGETGLTGMRKELADIVGTSGQLYEEFELDRGSLFRGEAGGLKATPTNAPRLLGFTGLGRLAVNAEGRMNELLPMAFTCVMCHLDHRFEPGKGDSPMIVLSLYQAERLLARPWDGHATTATLEWKSGQESYRRLRAHGN